MMMMTVMMRIMTWIIIVNESRKQSNKIEKCLEKENKLVISVCTKARKEVENQVFVGQLHFYNSHFFIDFTFDLFLLIEKWGWGKSSQKGI